ncbi:MAG: hypothetical protein JO356_02565 [Acidobacteria bacterium]|nr:hypothetical protein [Acidobacteriota bacterium]
MRIAAIITISEQRQRTGDIPSSIHQLSRTLTDRAGYQGFDILGENLLSRTLHRIERITSLPPVILSEGAKPSAWLLPRASSGGTYVTACEKAAAEQIQQGAELLLLTRLNAYTDLDYQQLLEFHCQSGSSLTRVYAGNESLDVVLVNASALNGTVSEGKAPPLSRQRRFIYRGYVNRLRHPHEYCQLIADGLSGRCGLEPRGVEVSPGVWHAAGARIDRDATIAAPVFIGSDSQVAASALVRGTSIEKNCHIDCGTAVTNSWVVENTYVGVALEVRRCVVSSQTLFHLDRAVELSINDARLIGVNSKTIPFVSSLESFLWGASGYGA